MNMNKFSLLIIFTLLSTAGYGCSKHISAPVTPTKEDPKTDVLRIWSAKSIDKGKSGNSPAAVKIVADADKYLGMTMVSVVDKPDALTAPSGDKHDYVSIGRYWWPNPNTPNGLPYIRKDGQVNPEIDKFDKTPMERLIKSVYSLSLAYYITKNEKYAEKAIDNLKMWFINPETKMNPHMNYGQYIPGVDDNKGRSEGVIETYEMAEMLDGVYLLKRSKKYTEDVDRGLKDWFGKYLTWLQTSEIGKTESIHVNNHSVQYDVQVVRYALFAGKEDMARQILGQFPAKRIYKQIEPDGSQPYELSRTNSFSYSVYNLMHLMDMAMIAKSLNIDLLGAQSADGRSIIKAVQYLLPYEGKPVTAWPHEQISDWDKYQLEFAWVLLRNDNMKDALTYKNYYSGLLAQYVSDRKYLIY